MPYFMKIKAYLATAVIFLCFFSVRAEDENVQEFANFQNADSISFEGTVVILKSGTPQELHTTLKERKDIQAFSKWLQESKLRPSGLRHNGNPPIVGSEQCVNIDIKLPKQITIHLSIYGDGTLVVSDDVEFISDVALDLNAFFESLKNKKQ
jgi:hypothetical protein